MQCNDLEKSSSKRASAAKTNSDATAGFPSAHSKEKQSSMPQQKQTSGFENQDKDSEDAESFDEEKQKTQVLNDLNMADSDDEDDEEPQKPVDASRKK